MSAPDRRAMLDRADKALSVRRQCALLGVARSGAYRALKPANDNDAALMRRIDELFTAWPFLGSRRMTAMLRAEGVDVNRKRVQRLMRLMGIARARAEAENEQTRARPPDLSLSPAQSDDRARKPRLGGRHHLQSDRAGLSPSGGDYRLGVARGACVAAVEHDRRVVLPRHFLSKESFGLLVFVSCRGGRLGCVGCVVRLAAVGRAARGLARPWVARRATACRSAESRRSWP